MPFTNEALTDFSAPENIKKYQAALDHVRTHLDAEYPLIIGDDRIVTGRWLTSVNPGRVGETVGRAAMGNSTHIDQALGAAWERFARWRRRPADERVGFVRSLADVMRRRRFELAAWMTFEAGKNFAEADADVAEAIDFCEYYAEQALPLAGERPTYPYPGENNTVVLVPLGAGAVISPWNFPLAIFTGMAVGPAVVGNTVVLKPSPDTPIVAHKFMECAAEAGFPPGVFNLVVGADDEIGDHLVDHPRTRFINFTGSLATGVRINQRAAVVHPGQRWIKKVQLEMGGKDALIVDGTADLDYAAREAVASGYGFGGQKCSAMSRLIAVDSIHDALLERVADLVEDLTVGPADENPDYSALINEKARA
ncbi:MAG: aldehyde dehydrogenase family protein, partial [Acidimicrobiia bacterium]|nr:aldehyde dehydrogenase family protein [Acidimicrobiia bacterium]